MAKIFISLPDELRSLHRRTKIENRSALIESLLQQWQQQEDEAKRDRLCLGR